MLRDAQPVVEMVSLDDCNTRTSVCVENIKTAPVCTGQLGVRCEFNSFLRCIERDLLRNQIKLEVSLTSSVVLSSQGCHTRELPGVRGPMGAPLQVRVTQGRYSSGRAARGQDGVAGESWNVSSRLRPFL